MVDLFAALVRNIGSLCALYTDKRLAFVHCANIWFYMNIEVLSLYTWKYDTS